MKKSEEQKSTQSIENTDRKLRKTDSEEEDEQDQMMHKERMRKIKILR